MSVRQDRPIISGAPSAPRPRKPKAASILTKDAAALKPDDLLFGPFLDRGLVAIPPNYLPHAPGVLFAGPRMLKYAGCKSGVRCSYSWERIEPGVYVYWLPYEKVEGYDTLRVRQSGDWRSKHWAVERIDSCTGDLQALVFAIETIPIWAHSRREAMFLAEFYRKDHALRLVGCGWAKPFCSGR
jgi:hypothetical protein